MKEETENPTAVKVAETATVVTAMRLSCVYCARMKRKCSGGDPCELCIRRRKPCMRSVRRKSGPMKGAKYAPRQNKRAPNGTRQLKKRRNKSDDDDDEAEEEHDVGGGSASDGIGDVEGAGGDGDREEEGERGRRERGMNRGGGSTGAHRTKSDAATAKKSREKASTHRKRNADTAIDDAHDAAGDAGNGDGDGDDGTSSSSRSNEGMPSRKRRPGRPPLDSGGGKKASGKKSKTCSRKSGGGEQAPSSSPSPPHDRNATEQGQPPKRESPSSSSIISSNSSRSGISSSNVKKAPAQAPAAVGNAHAGVGGRRIPSESLPPLKKRPAVSMTSSAAAASAVSRGGGPGDPYSEKPSEQQAHKKKRVGKIPGDKDTGSGSCSPGNGGSVGSSINGNDENHSAAKTSSVAISHDGGGGDDIGDGDDGTTNDNPTEGASGTTPMAVDVTVREHSGGDIRCSRSVTGSPGSVPSRPEPVRGVASHDQEHGRSEHGRGSRSPSHERDGGRRQSSTEHHRANGNGYHTMAVSGAPWGGHDNGGGSGDISQQRPPSSCVRKGEMSSSSPVARRYYDIRPSCPTTSSVAAAATLVKEEDGRRYWAAVGGGGGGGGGDGDGKRSSASCMLHLDQDSLYLPLVVAPREEILRPEALDIIAVRERWGRRNRDYEGWGGCVSHVKYDSPGRGRWKHTADACGRGGDFCGDRGTGYGPSGHSGGRVVGRTGATGDYGQGAMQINGGHEGFRLGLSVPPVPPSQQQRGLTPPLPPTELLRMLRPNDSDAINPLLQCSRGAREYPRPVLPPPHQVGDLRGTVRGRERQEQRCFELARGRQSSSPFSQRRGECNRHESSSCSNGNRSGALGSRDEATEQSACGVVSRSYGCENDGGDTNRHRRRIMRGETDQMTEEHDRERRSDFCTITPRLSGRQQQQRQRMGLDRYDRYRGHNGFATDVLAMDRQIACSSEETSIPPMRRPVLDKDLAARALKDLARSRSGGVEIGCRVTPLIEHPLVGGDNHARTDRSGDDGGIDQRGGWATREARLETQQSTPTQHARPVKVSAAAVAAAAWEHERHQQVGRPLDLALLRVSSHKDYIIERSSAGEDGSAGTRARRSGSDVRSRDVDGEYCDHFHPIGGASQLRSPNDCGDTSWRDYHDYSETARGGGGRQFHGQGQWEPNTRGNRDGRGIGQEDMRLQVAGAAPIPATAVPTVVAQRNNEPRRSPLLVARALPSPRIEKHNSPVPSSVERGERQAQERTKVSKPESGERPGQQQRWRRQQHDCVPSHEGSGGSRGDSEQSSSWSGAEKKFPIDGCGRNGRGEPALARVARTIASDGDSGGGEDNVSNCKADVASGREGKTDKTKHPAAAAASSASSTTSIASCSPKKEGGTRYHVPVPCGGQDNESWERQVQQQSLTDPDMDNERTIGSSVAAVDKTTSEGSPTMVANGGCEQGRRTSAHQSVPAASLGQAPRGGGSKCDGVQGSNGRDNASNTSVRRDDGDDGVGVGGSSGNGSGGPALFAPCAHGITKAKKIEDEVFSAIRRVSNCESTSASVTTGKAAITSDGDTDCGGVSNNADSKSSYHQRHSPGHLSGSGGDYMHAEASSPQQLRLETTGKEAAGKIPHSSRFHPHEREHVPGEEGRRFVVPPLLPRLEPVGTRREAGRYCRTGPSQTVEPEPVCDRRDRCSHHRRQRLGRDGDRVHNQGAYHHRRPQPVETRSLSPLPPLPVCHTSPGISKGQQTRSNFPRMGVRGSGTMPPLSWTMGNGSNNTTRDCRSPSADLDPDLMLSGATSDSDGGGAAAAAAAAAAATAAAVARRHQQARSGGGGLLDGQMRENRMLSSWPLSKTCIQEDGDMRMTTRGGGMIQQDEIFSRSREGAGSAGGYVGIAQPRPWEPEMRATTAWGSWQPHWKKLRERGGGFAEHREDF